MLGTYQPGEFIFQCPIFLPFHTVQVKLHRENVQISCKILKYIIIQSTYTETCKVGMSYFKMTKPKTKF